MPLRAITAIAATYVYFLLFAQFAFLDLVQGSLGTPAEVKVVMAAMGLAGLAASLATAWALGRVSARSLLLAGFAACGSAAVWASRFGGSGTPESALLGLVAAGATIGASTGLLTVSLASSLGWFVGGRKRGLESAGSYATHVGLGTGLAYLVCNLPPLFEGSIAVRCLVAAGVCAVGFGAVWAGHLDPRRSGPRLPAPRADYLGAGLVTIVLSFVALIWLDSAAFAIIQETAALKALTWGSGVQKVAIGVVHLAGAVAAGRFIDRGRMRALLVATFASFAIALPLLESGSAAVWLAAPLYAMGIAFYSTALVAYPASRSDEPGLVPVRWRAGLLFGVGGWIGSALGVGMAQSLHEIPTWFVGVAGILIALSWAFGGRFSDAGARSALPRGGARRLSRAARLMGLPLVLGVTVFGLAKIGSVSDPEEAGREASSAAERGRAVYVREGCINCHSQYVRPGTADVALWGPFRPVDGTEQPPLLGNRRQGPDLRNVGNRRTSVWQRLHLEDPRRLVPGSRMPSYGHLFDSGTTDGEDLVAYLASLGADTARDRYELTRAFKLAEAPAPASAENGSRVFAGYCAPCHGLEARGDGPLAKEVFKPRSAINLTKETFWLVSWGDGAESEDAALARAVKFGIANTSMPGHEFLSDQQIADVVAFVRTARDGARTAEGEGKSSPDADAGAAG